jgi:hypothetical protein
VARWAGSPAAGSGSGRPAAPRTPAGRRPGGARRPAAVVRAAVAERWRLGRLGAVPRLGHGDLLSQLPLSLKGGAGRLLPSSARRPFCLLHQTAGGGRRACTTGSGGAALSYTDAFLDGHSATAISTHDRHPFPELQASSWLVAGRRCRCEQTHLCARSCWTALVPDSVTGNH